MPATRIAPSLPRAPAWPITGPAEQASAAPSRLTAPALARRPATLPANQRLHAEPVNRVGHRQRAALRRRVFRLACHAEVERRRIFRSSVDFATEPVSVNHFGVRRDPKRLLEARSRQTSRSHCAHGGRVCARCDPVGPKLLAPCSTGTWSSANSTGPRLASLIV